MRNVTKLGFAVAAVSVAVVVSAASAIRQTDQRVDYPYQDVIEFEHWEVLRERTWDMNTDGWKLTQVVSHGNRLIGVYEQTWTSR